MSNQRRNFVRNSVLAFVGTSLYASDFLTGNSILNYSKNSSGLIKNLNNKERIIFEKLLKDGYQISIRNQFLLNEKCAAYHVSRNSLLWGKEEKLLLIIDNDYFLLNKKQQEVCNNFISSYAMGVKENKILSSVADFVTPTQILKTNTSGNFRYKNSHGNIFEVHANQKNGYVKIVS